MRLVDVGVRRTVVAVVVGALALNACAVLHNDHAKVVTVQHTAPPVTGSVTPTPTVPPTPSMRLVRWRGPVEQLFVHPLVLRPQLAFTRDRLGQGFADYFVTAREFRRILDQLWRNGWTLVDARRVAAGDVRVPPGRKPLVLQEDDANYYAYFHGRGLASRLVVDATGRVEAEYDGTTGPRLTDEDVVPLVDEAVAAHPALSADGAKGLIAETGYEGLFGEHDLADPSARARVRALAGALRADGWVIASHTYGHINLAKDSLSVIARDTERWKQLTDDLLGPVDILVYPFGARPSPAGRQLLRDAGFTVQYDIDVRPKRTVEDGVVLMSRRHVDGYAFADPQAMSPFFSVATVRDPHRPG